MATLETETFEGSAEEDPEALAGQPGLLLIFSGAAPRSIALPLAADAIELGRDELAAAGAPDGRVSRRHVRVEHAAGLFSVRDLGSRNGTFVDGRKLGAARELAAPVIRIGGTLLLAVHDIRPYQEQGVTSAGGVVMGPLLRETHRRIGLAAQAGAHLLLQGETGSGKELAAETFHTAGAGGPLVAVNCAAIQKHLAERVLFGARRGAYTGATSDMQGLVQAAHGGTLFLDEICELDADVQAKLLRAIETRKVTPLGAVSPIAVQFRLCAATHKDLRAAVVQGLFREDLYFRIGRPLVRLPPLRKRREEIPWLCELALAGQDGGGALKRQTASVELMEACLLRAWSGNVRELLAEIKTAALSAASRGRMSVLASDLDSEAGRALGESAAQPPPADESAAATPSREDIETALRAEQGNVARTAARLGMARSKLRRHIERHGIDVKALAEK